MDIPVMPKLRKPPWGAKVIRVTERQTFRSCRRKWKYAMRYKLQPKAPPSDARTLGTALHAALAEYYKSQIDDHIITRGQHVFKAWDKWVEQEPILDPEQYELGTAMLDGYFRYCQIEDEGYTPIAVEQTMYAKIPHTRVWLQGTTDCIFATDRGLWVMDHKSYRTFRTPEQLEFDDQTLAYIWLCRQNGIRVRGAILNMMRKKIPHEPQLLKAGGLSRNKSIDTDWPTYLRAIEDNNLNPEHYEDMKELLTTKDCDFFRRERVSRTEAQLDDFEYHLTREARDMFNPTLPLYPNRSDMTCSFCDFKVLCRTESDGGDIENVISSLYDETPEATAIRRES